MPTVIIDRKEILFDSEGERIGYTKQAFANFSPLVMGLGDISLPSRTLDALCAVFDLEGFTTFCSGMDPQLEIPTFMTRYLTWLFDEIKAQTISEETEEGYQTWHDLPFFVKFMGDGGK